MLVLKIVMNLHHGHILYSIVYLELVNYAS